MLRVGFRVCLVAVSCKDALGLHRLSISCCCVLLLIEFVRLRHSSHDFLRLKCRSMWLEGINIISRGFEKELERVFLMVFNAHLRVLLGCYRARP